MSTDKSPALNGALITQRLKEDLADLGVFDYQVSLYLLDKLREYGVMGFSGFEGRYYSLFESLSGYGPAVTLQNLLYFWPLNILSPDRSLMSIFPMILPLKVKGGKLFLARPSAFRLSLCIKYRQCPAKKDYR